MEPEAQLKAQKQLARALREIGNSEVVERFIRSFGNVRVKALYASHLSLYFRWLKNKTPMTHDELVVDNLRCIYKSEPEDVTSKRKHRAWLEEYVNESMKGRSYSYRESLSQAVLGFYTRNDSPLFGKLKVADHGVEAPDKAVKADDIRKVLKALPLAIRTPLLCIWQSSCELNRVLGLRWKDLEGLEKGEYPLKLQFPGRKGHKRHFHTYLGRDAIDHLKLWKARWEEIMERSPQPDDLVFVGKRKNSGTDSSWLNEQFKEQALRMYRQGLIENGNRSSWHSHALRHSFKTEGEYSRVKSALIEFFQGHSGGIEWVYDNRDETHEEDFIEAYKKLEPFVSLDYTETALKAEFEEERKSWINEIRSLREEVSRLLNARDSQASQGGPSR